MHIKHLPIQQKDLIALVEWVEKLTEPESCPLCNGSTGVYHESLAYFLDEKGYEVSIVLPNKISNYCQDTGSKNCYGQNSFRSNCPVWTGKKVGQMARRPKEIFKN